jgi:hypothetical protein
VQYGRRRRLRLRTEEQFESLESAHDFVALLGQTIAEAKRELERDVERESLGSRRLDALRIALYDLEKMELHIARTSRPSERSPHIAATPI